MIKPGEGMNFFGSELVRIIEEVLPRIFGGTSIDYQIVEGEDELGRTRVNLVISPGIGPLDEEAVMQTVLTDLSRGGDDKRMMVNMWSQAKTLRVQRRQPITTVSGKLLPLHIQKKR